MRKIGIVAILLVLTTLSGCSLLVRSQRDVERDKDVDALYRTQAIEYLETKYPDDTFDIDLKVTRSLFTTDCYGAITSQKTGIIFDYMPEFDDYGSIYYRNELSEDLLQYCKDLSKGCENIEVTDIYYPDGIKGYHNSRENMFLVDRAGRLDLLLDPENTSFYVNVEIKLKSSRKYDIERELQEYIDKFPHPSYVNICDEDGKTRYKSIMYTTAYGGDTDFIEEWMKDEGVYQ